MPPPDFASFLEHSLAILGREAPSHYAELAALLGDRGLCCEVDECRVALRFDGARHALRAPDEGEALRLRTDRRTILALVDGELSLLDALLEERLWLAGSADDVTRFDEALGCYLDGAVRCPSFPALLTGFRCDRLAVTPLPAVEALR